MGKRRVRLIMCGVIVVMGGLVPALPASASTSPVADSSAPTAAQLANQQIMSGLRTWLMDQPEYAQGEYISSTDDLDNRSMTVMWHGTSVFEQKFLDQARSLGIAVSMRASLYSAAQLAAAGEKILGAPILAAAGGLIPQVVIGDDPKFNGLVVKTAYTDGGISDGRSASSAQLDSVAQQAAAVSGYPVQVVLGDTYHAGTTRDTDTPQFNAGGLMIHGGSICSNAFAIKISGVSYTSTARHCTAVPWTGRDSSTSYGTTKQVDNTTQWRYLTTAGFYWMFDGSYSTSSYKTVNGYTDVGVGDYVFTSGGNSGTHANLKVNNVSVQWNDGYGVASLIDASPSNNTVSFVAGDSGGPVFGYHADNVTVGAAGMMQYYSTTPTGGCGAMHDGGNPCGSHTGFTSAHATVNTTSGASLVTG